jgi:putative transposase
MSVFIKSYKYRIYPNIDQKKYLDRNFGAVRFVWNRLVENFNKYGTDEYIKNYDYGKLKKDYNWLDECSSNAIAQKIQDFVEFQGQYFSKTRKKKLGRPKFKKRGLSADTMRFTSQKVNLRHLNFKNNTVKLPKLVQPVKVNFHRYFTGEIRFITVSKDTIGDYYISVSTKEEINIPATSNRDVGIDLGLNDLLILSNGLRFENPKYFRKTQAELSRSQKHLARKTRGSNRYNKQKLKVAKIHKKISRQREWYYHNITTWLVRKYDTIILENLNVSGMVRNRKMSKSINDAAWSTLAKMLQYKSKWYGKEIHQIGRFFSSSKTCSCCGHKVEKMPLSVRNWTCEPCGVNHDRDLNAAFNIYKQGMLGRHGLMVTSAEYADYSRGETIGPDWFTSKARLYEAISFNLSYLN